MFLNWLLKWKTYQNNKHCIWHPKEGQFAYSSYFFHLLYFICSISLFFHHLNEVPCEQPNFVYFQVFNKLVKIKSVMGLSFNTQWVTLLARDLSASWQNTTQNPSPVQKRENWRGPKYFCRRVLHHRKKKI